MNSLIIALVLSPVIIFGTLVFLKMQLKKSMSGSTSELRKQMELSNRKLQVLLGAIDSYGSSKQYEKIKNQREVSQVELEKFKKELVESEQKLIKAQKDIEDKENQQQNLKLNKDVDENKLHELLAGFADMTSESEALEKKIAQSMDNLDNLKSELQLTEEQSQALDKLSDALSTAGALLRDLITEQQGVQERLDMLNAQHDDLEDEYTRLVEQQLGE